ncbi:Beta-ketoacyl synthase [Ophiocordyceps camponoti-floridani]|uniref:Beta-ketoacyl synthase n=1 Tax=Ophiocordyceps camponoti-floridani TaxID=2030778 RepID=A0A8H4Q7E2_9HYPO|nr:Beta-ketoacyl synthase [Ophiocordyceps camponoti-floridani]
MSHDNWKACLEPKVTGTWNLHNALIETKLDFFVLISSTSGTTGNLGQVNYAAASCFLDSFVQYRHGLGLPCSVVDLGAVEGVGVLGGKQNVVEAIQLAVMRSSPENSTIPTSPRGLYCNKSQIIIGLTSSRSSGDFTNRLAFTNDARAGLLTNMNAATSGKTLESSDSEINQLISRFEADPGLLTEPDAIDMVSHEIGRILLRL